MILENFRLPQTSSGHRCRRQLRQLLTQAIVAGITLSMWVGSATAATDISREVRHGRDATNGFVELGLALGAARFPIAGASPNTKDADDINGSLGIVLNAVGSWNGLFAELLYDSFGGVALGYHLIDNDNISLDVLVTNTFGYLDPEQEGFETIEERDADGVAGIRGNFYLGNSIIQLSLLSDISDTHDGHSASLQWGRYWQVRNWNLHLIGGARYFSDRLNNYYFGISESESTDALPQYQADAGWMGEVEIGATVPLNENWVFRSRLQVVGFDEAISDSPLALDNNGFFTDAALIYVF